MDCCVGGHGSKACRDQVGLGSLTGMTCDAGKLVSGSRNGTSDATRATGASGSTGGGARYGNTAACFGTRRARPFLSVAAGGRGGRWGAAAVAPPPDTLTQTAANSINRPPPHTRTPPPPSIAAVTYANSHRQPEETRLRFRSAKGSDATRIADPQIRWNTLGRGSLSERVKKATPRAKKSVPFERKSSPCTSMGAAIR